MSSNVVKLFIHCQPGCRTLNHWQLEDQLEVQVNLHLINSTSYLPVNGASDATVPERIHGTVDFNLKLAGTGIGHGVLVHCQTRNSKET